MEKLFSESKIDSTLIGEIFYVNLIPASCRALMIIPSTIEGYTFDRIILFEGFISFLIGMILFPISICALFLTKLSAIV